MLRPENLDKLRLCIQRKSKDVFKFIPLLDNEMLPVLELKTCSACFDAFYRIDDVYNCCCQIAEFVDFDDFAKGTRLQCLSGAVAVRKGALNLSLALSGAGSLFETLLVIASFLAHKSGSKSNLFRTDYLEVYNTYKYRPLDLGEDYRVIRESLSAYRPETDGCLDALEANRGSREKPADPAFLTQFEAALNDERAFDYYHPDKISSSVYEERTLLSMLSVSIGKDGEIRPAATSPNGAKFPDFDLWTPELLSSLRTYFGPNESALFCLEVIGFLLYRDDVSPKSQKKIVDRVINSLQSNDWAHTSFLYLLSLLKRTDKLSKNAKVDYFIALNKIPVEIEDADKLRLLSDLELAPPKVNEKIDEIDKSRLEELLSAGTSSSLEEIFDDPHFYKYITSDMFKRISELFYSFLSSPLRPSEDVHLYVSYGNFLTSQMIRNPVGDEKLIEEETLKLWKSWKRFGYQNSLASLESFSSSPTSIPIQEIDNYNNEILEDARNFGWRVFTHDKRTLLGKLGDWDSDFSRLFGQIDIEEDFPQTSHITETKFVAVLKEEIASCFPVSGVAKDASSYVEQFYESIRYSLLFYLFLFDKEAELYGRIRSALPDADLLPYEEGKKISLGLVAQLFPLLENLVLEDAILNGICPLNSKTDGLAERLEPSDVLFARMKECKERDGDLNAVSDLAALFHMIYDKNSLNIRNRLVHGANYPSSDGDLKIAFKATLISLAIMIKRIQTERDNDEFFLVKVVG